ncbi:AAA family ATPase [Picrophilus oshimae]|uniref:Hypothetical archaeal protein n=1 Tax=Picrophilus torridus (strain ATCC 700027 / DSM 9790 / JCM 10055 / NBRC 100828 / KAW 2/3) TaxID=1122961 RepID=Q6L0I6_PICTO|nr:ATP-binding protein [Picrophilus oshimae]AAT43516.1 hypothetical archaeal protein [Picrophilus oshimae DSM 9789]SMD30172.1 hypothetical protein SAMN02745355_0034 [Picrophilus oshimae DSM 9789]
MKFIFGRELDLNELYDRKDEISDILKSYKTRQPLAVTGYRRMGKSSILNAARSILEKNDVLVVKFNIEGITSVNDYSSRLLNALIDSISKRYRLKYYREEIKRKINLFLGGIEQIGIRFDNFEFILKRYNDYLDNRLKASEIIENIIDMPEKFAEDLGTKMVLMIDEFQYIRMLKEPFPEILRTMRSRFNEHKNVNYIISGSETGILDEMLNNHDEPFYAFFKNIEIGPFNHDQSIDFLSAGFKDMNLTCDIETLEKIYIITGGIPAWLNLAGIDLSWNKCSIDSFLQDPTYKNIINHELSMLTRNELSLIKMLSSGKGFNEIKISNKYRVVKSLIRHGLVRKINNEYKISDNLINYYLRIQ